MPMPVDARENTPEALESMAKWYRKYIQAGGIHRRPLSNPVELAFDIHRRLKVVILFAHFADNVNVNHMHEQEVLLFQCQQDFLIKKITDL